MIVKNIITNSITLVDSLLISSFKPRGLKTVLEGIPKSDYVLGVGYSEGDYQICISGRRKINEQIHSTVSREMYEELSLVPAQPVNIILKDKKNYFFAMNIVNTTLMTPLIGSHSPVSDSTDRAIICVHGKMHDIFNYIDLVQLPEDNGDFITHIWAESAEGILKYF